MPAHTITEGPPHRSTSRMQHSAYRICGMNLADGWDQGNSLLPIGKHWSKLCRRNGQNFPRTTPDNLSKACVRDAWNVSRHEEDIHIIEHCCLCLVYFILWHWLLCKTWTAHSVTFCDFWFSDQDAVYAILFLCNKDNHFLLGMWLVMDYCTIPVYKIVYFYGVNFCVQPLKEVGTFFCWPVYIYFLKPLIYIPILHSQCNLFMSTLSC